MYNVAGWSKYNQPYTWNPNCKDLHYNALNLVAQTHERKEADSVILLIITKMSVS